MCCYRYYCIHHYSLSNSLDMYHHIHRCRNQYNYRSNYYCKSPYNFQYIPLEWSVRTP